MKSYLLAISGGVDSMVLLDMFASRKTNYRIIVAHVSHGIREESLKNANFVKLMAKKYKLPYVESRLELGMNASENLAREARYSFLFDQAEKFNATIVTAHHSDDLLGSVLINFQRKTGWRGLCVLSRKGILRPLLYFNKQKIYNYALDKKLEWWEDETNTSSVYLRNRNRKNVINLDSDVKNEIIKLRTRQIVLRSEIESEIEKTSLRSNNKRYWFLMVDESVAIEVLRKKLFLATGENFVDDKLKSLLLAIKTSKPQKVYVLNKTTKIIFKKDEFDIVFWDSVL